MKNRKLLNIELNRLSLEDYKQKQKSGLVLVLDNIRSAFNIGSAFRTSDSFNVDKIYLCGICATPPSAEIHKSGLGAENSVEWEYQQSTVECIKQLQSKGYKIISIEQTINSISLEKFEVEKGEKYALVFGNEVDGVQQEIVDQSDMSIEIPQFGTKHSLNVSVCIGVTLWNFIKS